MSPLVAMDRRTNKYSCTGVSYMAQVKFPVPNPHDLKNKKKEPGDTRVYAALLLAAAALASRSALLFCAMISYIGRNGPKGCLRIRPMSNNGWQIPYIRVAYCCVVKMALFRHHLFRFSAYNVVRLLLSKMSDN